LGKRGSTKTEQSKRIPRRSQQNSAPFFCPAQLWFLDRLSPKPTYNLPAAVRFAGQLNSSALQQTLSLSRRHGFTDCLPEVNRTISSFSFLGFRFVGGETCSIAETEQQAEIEQPYYY